MAGLELFSLLALLLISASLTISTVNGQEDWFTRETKLCMDWVAGGDAGQCWGPSNNLCANVNQMTPYFGDDTDERAGGCLMRWGIITPAGIPDWMQDVQVCFRWQVTPGGNAGQCQNGVERGEYCARVGTYTTFYDNDSDGRAGACQMSWRLQVPAYAPAWMRSAKLCYSWHASPGAVWQQCGAPSGDYCAVANTWTPFYNDDTDRRAGGCNMAWGIQL